MGWWYGSIVLSKTFWKKALKPVVKRELADCVRKQVQTSLRLDCRAFGISDSVYRYRPVLHRDDEVIAKLQEVTERYLAYGFDKVFAVLKRWGHAWNYKRVLERIIAWIGYLGKLRMDNGPEFISTALAEWAEEKKVEFEFIRSGKPIENSYLVRFNWACLTEVPDMCVLKTLSEVRKLT